MEGVVGGDVDMSIAKEAARRCAIAILAEAQSHLGSLDRIKRCVWVEGMVNACTGFRGHPAVINEVSQLFLDVFGDAGQHARVAFGVGGLPFNAPVEVQALFELQ